MFWGITFDKTQSTWHSVFLDKKWSDPVNKVLISNHIGISVDYHSNLTDLEQRKVQEELVTSNLLDCIENGCYLNYRNGKYVLYPYNAKGPWRKYIIADNRNRILSSLYGGEFYAEKQSGKIYTNHKIEGCDFFRGWDIDFKYVDNNVEYDFRWQNCDRIYMYKADNRLCDDKECERLTIDGSKISNDEDLINEMKQCIDRYKESHIDQNA